MFGFGRWHNVEMVRAFTAWPIAPKGFAINEVPGPVDVTELANRRKEHISGDRRSNARHDVDDRLCHQLWNRRTSDVFDPVERSC